MTFEKIFSLVIIESVTELKTIRTLKVVKRKATQQC